MHFDDVSVAALTCSCAITLSDSVVSFRIAFRFWRVEFPLTACSFRPLLSSIAALTTASSIFPGLVLLARLEVYAVPAKREKADRPPRGRVRSGSKIVTAALVRQIATVYRLV